MANLKDPHLFKKSRAGTSIRVQQEVKDCINALLAIGAGKNYAAITKVFLDLGMAEYLKTLTPEKKSEYEAELVKIKACLFPDIAAEDLDIEKIPFKPGTMRMLKLNGVNRVSDLAAKTEKQIEGLYGIGPKGLLQIKAVLEHYNIKLKS